MKTVLPRILVALLFVLNIQHTNAQSVTYSPLYDNTTFAKTIDLSKAVGSIDATAGTTPSGAATYSIPIKCPPGTHGIVPNLSIEYNSHGSNGLLGQGWNLSGSSVITRGGKDLFHDNKVGSVTYTNDDAFLMDGTRLSTVTGTNGANGTTYRTESENYSVTTSYGSVGGGPQYFKVVSKDGTIMEFGNSTDSRTMTNDGTVVMVWRLNKIQDVNGNYITFIYTNTNNGNDPITYPTTLNKQDNDGRDVQLAEIDYTGNASTGLAPYNVIKFSYVVRTDKHNFYDAGSSVASRYLLDNITVYAEGDRMKKYAFNYSFNNVKSYLKNVIEYAQNDGVALGDSRFKYGDLEIGPTTVGSNIDVTWKYSGTATNADVFSGDFDGDGKTEILTAHYKYNDFRFGDDASEIGRGYKDFIIYKSDPSGTTGSYMPLSGASDSWADDGKYLVSFNHNSSNSKNFVTSDFDGDGKDDLLFLKSTTNAVGLTTFDSISIYYSRSSSPGFSFDKMYYHPATIPPSTDPALNSIIPHEFVGKNNIILGDFDGDKRTDYMYFTRTVYSGTGVTYHVEVNHAFVSFPGKRTVDMPLMNPASLSVYDEIMANNLMNKDIYALDFDGDGKTDIMYTDGSYTYVYSVE